MQQKCFCFISEYRWSYLQGKIKWNHSKLNLFKRAIQTPDGNFHFFAYDGSQYSLYKSTGAPNAVGLYSTTKSPGLFYLSSNGLIYINCQSCQYNGPCSYCESMWVYNPTTSAINEYVLNANASKIVGEFGSNVVFIGNSIHGAT